MIIMRKEWWVTRQFCIQVKIANELWFDRTENGGRSSYFAKAGYYTHQDYPRVKLFSLIFLWISIQVGF